MVKIGAHHMKTMYAAVAATAIAQSFWSSFAYESKMKRKCTVVTDFWRCFTTVSAYLNIHKFYMPGTCSIFLSLSLSLSIFCFLLNANMKKQKKKQFNCVPNQIRGKCETGKKKKNERILKFRTFAPTFTLPHNNRIYDTLRW